MYSLEMFGRMFADPIRNDAYTEALRRVIRPGVTVLDIGTGVGVYAMLAARLGARRVYAVEINPLVRLGPDLAEANGLDDSIEFIEGLSTDITLPERVDVVVSDLRGVLPLYGRHLESLRDARERLLKPGGVMIPTRDELFVALSANPAGRRFFRDIWVDNPFGLDLSVAATHEANQLRRDRVESGDVLSEPVRIATIDYTSDLAETDVRWAGTVAARTSGEADGLSVWFDATVVDGVTYSTGPMAPKMIYGMAFLPFETSVDVVVGSHIDLEVSARLADDYVFDWSASGVDVDGKHWRVAQSSFRSAPIDLTSLARRRAGFVTPSTPWVAVDRAALEMIWNGRNLGEIAASLRETFPDVFDSPATALTYAADFAERYAD